jgi:hypothetical protein
MWAQGRQGREWREILFDKITAGRGPIRWRVLPTVRAQQLYRFLVGVELPWREHRDMSPLTYGMPGPITGFEDERAVPRCKQMTSSGKPDRTGANYCDRQPIILRHLSSVGYMPTALGVG